MKRLRPRTAVLGGAAIGLVAGAVVFGATYSTTVTAPVSKPASFTKQVPVRVAKPPPPVRRRKAPCAKNQELRHGVCIVHVKRVVIHYKPAPPVQALPQVQSRSGDGSASQQRSGSDDSSRNQPQSRPDDSSRNQPWAESRAQRSPEPQGRGISSVPRSHEAEPVEHEESSGHANAPQHATAEHQSGQETESGD